MFLGVDLAWAEGSTERRGNESGVAAVDDAGRVLDAGWRVGVPAVVAWIDEVSDPDTLLFIDAPLVVSNAGGQRLCEKQVGQRYGRWQVSANSTNVASPRVAGVCLRRELEERGWRYDDGRNGPPSGGRVFSETYPYTVIVGAGELGYDSVRPQYKRRPRHMRIADFRPIRADACDLLLTRMAALGAADPPLLMSSHPESRRLLEEPSPRQRGTERLYKHREDLLDGLLCAWGAAFWARHGFARCQVLGLSDQPGEAPVATIIAAMREDQRPHPPG